jgi:hypothetical protein
MAASSTIFPGWVLISTPSMEMVISSGMAIPNPKWSSSGIWQRLISGG